MIECRDFKKNVENKVKVKAETREKVLNSSIVVNKLLQQALPDSSFQYSMYSRSSS